MLGLATLFPEGKVCYCLLKIAKNKQRGVAAPLVYLKDARYQCGFFLT